MDSYLAEKLDREVERYQDKDFLKAAAAAFVLAAHADSRIGMKERSTIDETLKTEPGLQEFDFEKATQIVESYAHALKNEGEPARNVLYNKVRGMAGNHKRARTLMRVAYLIINADGRIDADEMQVFRHLCELLHLDPTEVWRQSWS